MHRGEVNLPRTIRLRRGSSGFGFTLRHLTVYPSATKTGDFNPACPLDCMETVFVKTLRKQGPAERAGIKKGDRILAINGESVTKKSNREVVSIIQKSDLLELRVVPRSEDVLQMTYQNTGKDSTKHIKIAWDTLKNTSHVKKPADYKSRGRLPVKPTVDFRPIDPPHYSKCGSVPDLTNGSDRYSDCATKSGLDSVKQFDSFSCPQWQYYLTGFSPYSTLDSAYHTAESSYNTVDSSCSRSTDLPSKTYKPLCSQKTNYKGINAEEIRKSCLVDTAGKANHSSRDKVNGDFSSNQHDRSLKRAKSESSILHTSTDSISYDHIDNEVVIHKQEHYQQISNDRPADALFHESLKYADETETDTDTETYFHCWQDKLQDSMSYVPDYIRPVNSLSPTSPIAASSSRQKSSYRPTLMRTITSPASSSSSKDNAVSPVWSIGERSSRRNSANAAPYIPSRDWRAPQEKVCSRVSIKDRLRSLESEAAVKLEIQNISPHKTRRKSPGSRLGSSNPNTPSHTARLASDKESAANYKRSQSLSPTVDDEVLDVFTDKYHNANLSANIAHDNSHVTAKQAPKPDIIQSHQPRISKTSNPLLLPKNHPREFESSSSMSPGKIESRFADYQKPQQRRKSSSESQSDVALKQPVFKQEPERSQHEIKRADPCKIKNETDVKGNHKSVESKDDTIPVTISEKEQYENSVVEPEISEKHPEVFCEAPITPDAKDLSSEPQSPSTTTTTEKPQISKKPSALVAIRWNKTDKTVLTKGSLLSVPLAREETCEENWNDKSRDNFSDNTLDSSMNDIEAFPFSVEDKPSLHRSSSLPKLLSSSTNDSRENLNVFDNTESVMKGTQPDGFNSEQSTPATKRNEKLGSKGVVRSFSLMWKTPSREALSRLGVEASAAGGMKSDELNLNLHKKFHADIPLNVDEPHQSTPSSLPSTEENNEVKENVAETRTTPESTPVPTRLDIGIVRTKKQPPSPIIIDIQTATATVPVELRSPRNEQSGQGFFRHGSRDKRNARVFMMPSSDSDSDNPLANMNRELMMLGNTVVSGSSTCKPAPGSSNLQEVGQDDVSLKHVPPVKFVPSVLKRNYIKSKSLTEEVKSVKSSSVSSTEKNEIYPELSGRRHVSNERKSPQSRLKHEKNDQRTKKELSPDVEHRRKATRSAKRSDSRSKSTDTRSHIDRNTGVGEFRHRSNSYRDSKRRNHHHIGKNEFGRSNEMVSRSHDRSRGYPSPRQEAVARAVKFGNTPDDAIPFIDESTSPTKESSENHKDTGRTRAASEGTLIDSGVMNGMESHLIRRIMPLGAGLNRSRSRSDRSPPRRTSYMEAMESSGDLTPDPDDNSPYSVRRSASTRGRSNQSAKFIRSNSADSVLSSIAGGQTPPTVVRRPRASSADRNVAKRVHRRSYQIATCPLPPKSEEMTTPQRQPSIRKLKNFFGESEENATPQIVDATEEAVERKGRRNTDSSILVLDEDQLRITRSGYLYFKVATIEKGKRTSSQKSWKSVWTILKDQKLYLCKDWNRNKNNLDVAPTAMPHQLSLEEEDPLIIKSSLVGIAYNYVKRRNVFRLTTFNGSEYLFQAENRDDMLAWISAIQEGSCSQEDGVETINEDLILRKTNQIESGISGRSPSIYRKLYHSPKADKRANRKRSPKPSRRNNLQVKDVDGSRRFKWRGSVNKIVKKFGTGQPFILSGTFGVHLEDCPPSLINEFVPFVVELCCRIVEERGLHFTGIYRVPGNNAALSSLQEDLNQHGVESIDMQDDRLRELNVVSSLLKSFFRKLPDPLFTNELYNDFIQANRKSVSEERLNSLRRLVHMLPGPHYETLKFLTNHLRLVADNCQTNKMEVRNLAIVFGPTLVRSTASDNMATMVTDMSDQCRIVESIIEHADWFFSDPDGVGADTLPQSNAPKDRSHEPVPSIEFLLDNVGRKPGDASGNTSDSSKSKCSNESEKDSFSRDVIDLLFGKKWKLATNRNNNQEEARDSSDDHGGFEDPHRRKARAASLGDDSTMLASTTLGNTNITVVPPTPSPVLSQPPSLPVKSDKMTQKSAMLNQDVSERLFEFYREHLERLSRTTIGQTPMTFSSTESSPQITPRNSQFEMTSYPYGIHVRKRSVDSFPVQSKADYQRIDYVTQMSLPGRSQPSIADIFPVVSGNKEIQSQPKSSASKQPIVSTILKETKDLMKSTDKPAPSTSTPVRNVAPAYKHPPNPYDSTLTKENPQEQSKISQNYFSDVNTDVSSISSDRSTLQGFPLSSTTGTDADDEASDMRKNSIRSNISNSLSVTSGPGGGSNADDGHDSDTSEMSIYVGESFEEKLRNLTNLDKTLERRPSRRQAAHPAPHMPLDFNAVELGPQNSCHEMLVDEPVPMAKPTPKAMKSPPKKVSGISPGKMKLTNVLSSPKPVLKALKRASPDKSIANPDGNAPFDKPLLRKSAQELYEEKKQQRLEQKRMKVRMKTGNASSDENMFNRFDPKRRVIRTSSGENENPLHSMANRAIPSALISANTEKQLSAKERLFDMKNQPHPVIRKKPSLSQERKKQRVIRRHTLSGIADFPEHSVWVENAAESANVTFRAKFPYNNIKEPSPSKSALSMYDLAYSSAAQNLAARNISAVDRLKPKGATSEMTLSNWMVRERLKNGPTRRNIPASVVRDNNNLSKEWNLNDKHRPQQSNSYV